MVVLWVNGKRIYLGCESISSDSIILLKVGKEAACAACRGKLRQTEAAAHVNYLKAQRLPRIRCNVGVLDQRPPIRVKGLEAGQANPASGGLAVIGLALKTVFYIHAYAVNGRAARQVQTLILSGVIVPLTYHSGRKSF